MYLNSVIQHGGGFRREEDAILAELRERLALITQLLTRLPPQTAGAATAPNKDTAEALQRLRAEANALREKLGALTAGGASA